MKNIPFIVRGIAAATLFAGMSVSAVAADWSPLQVRATMPDGAEKMIEYKALEKADQPWQICVSFPHMKDPYFIAADYGVIEEAKRLGVKVQVLDAGGYTQLSQQISQISNCVAGGAKAVVMVGISPEGLNGLLASLKSKGIKVVDAINGVTSTDVATRVLTSPYDEGLNLGLYLAKQHPAGSPEVKVGYLPGPAGAAFVNLWNNGFYKGIEGSAIKIVETKNGDIGKEIQARLVDNILQSHGDLDYIVGNAVAIEAAIPILKAHKLEGKVRLATFYATPLVVQALKNKEVAAVHVSPVVTTNSLALEAAVRALQAKEPEPLIRYDTLGRVYTPEDIDTLKVDTVLAPSTFKPVFSYDGK